MAKLKKKSNVVPMFSESDILNMGREYADISAQIKTLEARKKELAEKIKKGAEDFGVKDDKGSSYLENDTLILGRVCKKSFKINQSKAAEVLNAKGVGDVLDVVTVTTVNEDKLNKAVADGRISLNDVESFTDVSVSYSVSVKEKDAIAEVVQTSVARSRK